MDFDLPESAAAVREGVLAIAGKYDQDYWGRCDADKRWPEEVWRELVAGGWHALAIPEEHGGGGQGLLELAVALEALAEGGAGGAASFMYLLTPAFGGLTIARHGTAEQKREFLPGIASGEIETCFAITEPDAGSNSIAISTQARRDGDSFVVSGQKIWISGVERADFLVLVTRTTPAAEARPRTSGFTVLLVDVKRAVADGTLTYRPIPKLGTNTVASNMVFLDGVRVPADRVLGEVGQGSPCCGTSSTPSGSWPRRAASGPAVWCWGSPAGTPPSGPPSARRSAPTRASRSRSRGSRRSWSWPG